MVWIRTVDEEEAQGALRKVYDRIRGTRGRTANIFLSQSLNPEALEAHLDLYLRIMFGKEALPRQQREMIAVVVSAINNCEYCVAHHSAALKRYAPDQRLIGQLATNFEGAKLGPKETAMLEYASKLTERPGSITKDDIEELRTAGFVDEEILHVALVASYFNFVNRLASGLGVSIESEGGSGYKY